MRQRYTLPHKLHAQSSQGRKESAIGQTIDGSGARWEKLKERKIAEDMA